VTTVGAHTGLDPRTRLGGSPARADITKSGCSTSTRRYWLKDKEAPFATLLSVLSSYYHPEIRHENYEKLIRRALRDPEDDAKMATFKKELTKILRGHREGLPADAIALAAADDDWDTDEEFLAWLWHELSPNEPVPTPESNGSERDS
jgi:hypothetical protein